MTQKKRYTKVDRRPWQRMLSGRRLNLEEPTPLEIEIDDIAHGLSRVARWNGQTDGAWAFSVAQHSILVEALFAWREPDARPEQRLVALLHDAPEYVIGDLISPFKARMGEDYKAIETRIFEAILMVDRLGAHATQKLMKAIKTADRAAAYLEAVALARFDPEEATLYFKPQPWAIEAYEKGAVSLDPTPPDTAKSAFLERYAALKRAIAQAAAPRRAAG